jgi:glutamine amidotransferase
MSAKVVTILDLELGNLHSVARAFERAGASAVITSDPDVVRAADRVVVPGQGAIRQCSIALRGGLGDAVRESIARGTPYLGICLGMQCLFESSEEAPGVAGLGIYAGTVKRFASDLVDRTATSPLGHPLKVPHMGWNQVVSNHPYVAKQGDEDGWYYFVHSFHCVPSDRSLVAATTDYGGDFCSAIAKDNVFACQFHPEKSHHMGARLIERYLEAK